MSEDARLQKVIDTARHTGAGCSWRGVGHELVYRRWRRAATGLGVLSAALSASAGSALLSSANAGSTWAVAAGILGLLAAVLTAADSALGARDRMDENRKARASFFGLRADYWRLRDSPGDDPAAAEAKLKEIQERHKEVEMEAVPLDRWADNKVTKWNKQQVAKAKAARAEAEPEAAAEG